MSREVALLRRSERWLLVTSAYHMPRAMGAFRGVGNDIEPRPVADGSAEDAPHIAAHEWIGPFAYWLRGRTIALFPGEAHILLARTAANANNSVTRPG